MVHRVATNDNEWDSEWQWMTATDNEWQRGVQRVAEQVTANVTASDNASLRETTNDSKWQWVVIFDNFPFFEKERNLITQSKENRLNYEEDLLNQKQKQAPKKRYLQ